MSSPSTFPVLGGTDGFRALATQERGPGLMNPETIAGLTAALLEHQTEAGVEGPVVIAQDTRPSGDALRTAAMTAALSQGIDVIDLDVAPTPAAQKIAARVGAMATVVLTASHNPWQYNGWKGMLGSRKPNGQEVSDISQRYWRQQTSGFATPIGSSLHRVERSHDLERYVDSVVADITSEFGELPLKDALFVIDGAYGAGQIVTPDVFRRLGARVEKFSCDGTGNINDGCGAANLSGLQDYLEHRPDITKDPTFIGALANDGDADRVMGIGLDESGNLVDITGNHIMHAMALYPRQPGIVGTEYSNSAIATALHAHGVEFEHCSNGDVHVTEALRAKQAAGYGWTRGGEFTGHLIETEWLGSGDGVRNSAWYAAYAVSQGKTFGQLHEGLPLWPERMARIELPAGHTVDLGSSRFLQHAVQRAIDSGARPIVRASGTEPVIRVWAEAPDEALVDEAHRTLTDGVRATLEAA